MKNPFLKKIIATVFAILGTLIVYNAQTLNWQQSYTGNSLNEQGYDVHRGGDDRIYTCGYTTSGTHPEDALIISYTSTGTQNWVQTYNNAGNGNDEAHAMTTYGSSSSVLIYVVGTSYVGATNGIDAFLLKYNQSGTLQWDRTWGTTTTDVANCVTVDGSGNIYIAGHCATNGGDIFITKYNSSGTQQWNATYNGSAGLDDEVGDFKLNSAGTYLYLTGEASITSHGNDALIMKIDVSNGSYTSATYNSSGTQNDKSFSLAIDGSGNIYSVGSTMTASNLDGLFLKYNSSLTLQCNTTWNSSLNYDDEFYSVAEADSAGNPKIYVTGYTVTTATCDQDWVTLKYDGSCNLKWKTTYTGTSTTCATTPDIAYQILIGSSSGKVYVAGTSNQSPNGQNATAVRYNPHTGAQEWVGTYDRWGVQNLAATKYPLDLIDDACNSLDWVYITGFTYESNALANLDATTVCYGQCCHCGSPAGRIMGGEPASADTGGTSVIIPNPYSQTATFRYLPETIYNNASFVMYDMMGREVKRIENIDSYEFQIDRENLTNGIYFYRYIQGERILSSGKLVITE